METAQIVRASELVSSLARRDISGLSHEVLMAEYDAVAKLGRVADALEARYAGEIARRSTPDQVGGGLARRQGFGNATSMVASVTGGTQASARRSIEVGRALLPEPVLRSDDVATGEPDQGPPPTPTAPRFPAIAQASLAGDLSKEAAAMITSGLQTLADCVPREKLHDLERRLVDKAVPLGAREVRRLVAHAVARADLAGHEARERRQHSERYLTWSEDHTGMVTLSGRLDAVTAAPIRTVLEQMVTQQFRQRRDKDPTDKDQRTPGQMKADALSDLARHALGCKETTCSGIRTTIVVRMNLSDLNCGEGLGTIDGTDQPVSVSELRRLAGDAGVIPQVLGGPSEILDQGRNVRMFTRAQRLALLERDGGCAKCHAPPEHCEAHHIAWWEHGGRSDLNNGVMLCTRCHHDIHRQGWGIRIRNGAVEFIPPPHIDPLQRPRSGGLAAATLGGTDGTDPLETDTREGSVPTTGTRKNSVASATALPKTAGENSVRNAA